MPHGTTNTGEAQRVSDEDRARVHELLTRGPDADTPLARVALRMMEGEPINDACAAEGTNLIAAMSEWHAFAEKNSIVGTDGQRACIHVLSPNANS